MLTLVADYTIKDYPAGAEMVDYNIYTGLKIPYVSSRVLNTIDPASHYIISNATMLHPALRQELMSRGNYSILEHDYKIHPTRQPHRYPNNIFPKHELINLDFFKKAKQVFLQSTDHLECYRDNGVEAKFINLATSIWSEEELNRLEQIEEESSYSTHMFAIIGDTGPDKGQENAVNWCKMNTLDYFILPKLPQYQFYSALAAHPALVYMPNVKESFCRLVVEARCLSLNVISPKNFGAVREPWFHLRGKEMIQFLRQRSKSNLTLIQSLCQ